MGIQFANARDSIIALSTPPGLGAIAVIRLSGPKAIEICDELFVGALLQDAKSHTLHYGKIVDAGAEIDEVVIGLFKAPKSYTKEDVVEISCHGSPYIQQKIIEAFLEKGVRMAERGEFTFRAFRNGRFSLTQAEAVAELINSDNEGSHRQAIKQLRSGFAEQLGELRERLLHFASMLELENDFGEEDVAFASTAELKSLVEDSLPGIVELIDSYRLGNALKKGIPVVLAGKPNAGKSTLLNALLREEKAIVSEIAGTTRDSIEDVVFIDGVKYRFIDTAGLRQAQDKIERIGVARTKEKLESAMAVIYLFDAGSISGKELAEAVEQLNLQHRQSLILAANKCDMLSEEQRKELAAYPAHLELSAKTGEGINDLKKALERLVASGKIREGQFISNSRHYEALLRIQSSLALVAQHLEEGYSSDLLAMDLRQALYHIAELSGEVSSEDILGNIFSSFCIGK